jgi:RNA polymerase sigma-70 factor, ECF subfamily
VIWADLRGESDHSATIWKVETTDKRSPQLDERHDSDLKLAAAVLAKDRKATAEFVKLYSDGIYSYVRRRLIPRTDIVDDVVQEVFVAALDSLSQFRGTSSLKTWLLAIARHKVEDYYRSLMRRAAEEDTEEDLLLASGDPSPDDLMDRARLEDRVRTVLRSLPELYSMVLLWRYWERHTAREIADATGKTEKAVERILARARAQFKRKWIDE